MRSIHPYEDYVPEGATKLIIGSIPPQRFCLPFINENKLNNNDVKFFYGSKDNHFWKLLSSITNTKLTFTNDDNSIKERKELLKRLNCGITDVVESCIHKNGKSSDKDLIEIEYHDILKLLKENPSIEVLVCTSLFVKNSLNKHYCNDKKFKYKEISNREGTITLNNKEYKVIILYSPSPQALRGIKGEGKKIREEQYKKVFTIQKINS